MKHRLRVSSALGFPSKTPPEIAPDHRNSSEAALGLTREDSAQTRINIALSLYWWYFTAALGNGGNRFPLPAPLAADLPLGALDWVSNAFPSVTSVVFFSAISRINRQLCPLTVFRISITSGQEKIRGWSVGLMEARLVSPIREGHTLSRNCERRISGAAPGVRASLLN